MNSLLNIDRNLHRKIIGWLGILFPFILFGSNYAFNCNDIQTSISAYYHTSVKDLFSWVVIIIGIFFLTYPILDNYKSDKVPFRIAGVLALLVAFFPTFLKSENLTSCNTFINATKTTGNIHNISAVSFFLMLSYICFFLFTKGNKKLNNYFYKASGVIILVSIILIIIYAFWGEKQYPDLMEFKPTFILESVALIFFGLAYLIKGQLFRKQ